MLIASPSNNDYDYAITIIITPLYLLTHYILIPLPSSPLKLLHPFSASAWHLKWAKFESDEFMIYLFGKLAELRWLWNEIQQQFVDKVC